MYIIRFCCFLIIFGAAHTKIFLLETEIVGNQTPVKTGRLGNEDEGKIPVMGSGKYKAL
jgi:hypothetical protein